MLRIPLSFKSLVRDWRSGELTLLSLALIIAMTCVSSLNIFSWRVSEQLSQQTSQLLGADMVIRSSIPIRDEWIKKAQNLGLTQTITLSFLSMVGHDEKLQLAQIKAVQDPYPILGELKIANNVNSPGIKKKEGPSPGTVWISPRLLSPLNLHAGDSLVIGASSCIVTGIIIEEPGQTGDWFNISPPILINWQDLSATKVIQSGSNVSYRWLLAGPKTKLNHLKQFLQGKLTEQQELIESASSNPSVNQTIQRTFNYLNLGSLMSLVLAGVAISMASLRYSLRHMQEVAILRCFGASQYRILTIYMGSILAFGIISCLIGISLGYAVQPVFMRWLSSFLPQLSYRLSLQPGLFSLGVGLTVLVFFSLANILKLSKVTAITIFRKQQLIWTIPTWISYGMTFLILAALAYFYTKSWTMTGSILLGCFFIIGFVTGSLWLIFGRLATVKHYIHINWRFGFANIARNLANSSLQVIGIGLALTAILSLYILRNELLVEWRQQMSVNKANYFLINIEPKQVPGILRILNRHEVQVSSFYPMVKGRLIAINEVPVQQIFGEQVERINVLRRELNLSWTNELPPENTIISGRWLANPQDNWVSVEEGVVKKLGLKLGDRISFRIENEIVTVRMTSIRVVNWATFNPNFFTLFKPGILNNFPQTYIASFYLPPEKQPLLNRLVSSYPNITIIDIANLFSKIQNMFENTAKAINFIAFFVLLAGMIIVILAILSFTGIKQQETYILKVLGMGERQLLWIQSSESVIIGFYAGLLAVLTATLLNNYFATVILEIPFIIPWKLFLIIPVFTAIFNLCINSLVLKSQYQGQALAKINSD